MESRAKILGHSIHPMLIVFPLGLLATSVIFDLVAAFGGYPELHVVAYWMILAGVIGGLLAAIPGLVDFFAIPRHTRAWAVAIWHGVGNVAMLALFTMSWFLRRELPADPGTVALLLSVMGVGLSALTGWLGGELVERLGVSVDDGAHLDAPNSLSGRPASERPTSTLTRRPVEP